MKAKTSNSYVCALLGEGDYVTKIGFASIQERFVRG